MAPRLVHNALGPMAHKTKGMRWRIQGLCLRSDRGVCARRCAPGTNGQWLAKRCHLPFLGMRQVQKIQLATLVDSGARPEITPGEPLQRTKRMRWTVCARGYTLDTEGQRLAKRCLLPFLDMGRVCAGYKNPPPTLLILGLAQR